MEEKDIIKLIENKIDHYTPYRPWQDTNESKEARKALAELLGEVVDG